MYYIVQNCKSLAHKEASYFLHVSTPEKQIIQIVLFDETKERALYSKTVRAKENP